MFALLTNLCFLAAPQSALPLDVTTIGVDPFEPDRTLGAEDASLEQQDASKKARLGFTLFADGSLLLHRADGTAAGVFPARAKLPAAYAVKVLRQGRLVLVQWIARDGRVICYAGGEINEADPEAATEREVPDADRHDGTQIIVHRPGLPR